MLLTRSRRKNSGMSKARVARKRRRNMTAFRSTRARANDGWRQSYLRFSLSGSRSRRREEAELDLLEKSASSRRRLRFVIHLSIQVFSPVAKNSPRSIFFLGFPVRAKKE